MKMLTGSVFTPDDLVESARVMQKLKKGQHNELHPESWPAPKNKVHFYPCFIHKTLTQSIQTQVHKVGGGKYTFFPTVPEWIMICITIAVQ